MRHYSSYSIIRHSLPSSASKEEVYDENDLSSFFELSQKTGFSKKHLRYIWRKWALVTRNVMLPVQFSTWMRNIGFSDRNIINRIFEAFDEDGGGTLSFSEVCIGLSFIMKRDIRLPKFKLSQDDPLFITLCFKVIEASGNGTLSRFEVYQLVQAALSIKAKQTQAIVTVLWRKAFGENSTSNEEIDETVFRRIMLGHMCVWRFFRKVMAISALLRDSPKYVYVRDRAIEIILTEDDEDTDDDEADEGETWEVEEARDAAESRRKASKACEEDEVEAPPSVVDQAIADAIAGGLPEAQAEAYKEVFLMFDQDGSGEITITELAQALRDIAQHGEIAALLPKEEELPAIIAQVDTDEDGSLDIHEFLRMMGVDATKPTLSDEDPAAEMMRAFQAIDVDQNGKISKEELYQACGQMGSPTSRKQVDDLIAEADQDDNGLVDFEEFIALMSKQKESQS